MAENILDLEYGTEEFESMMAFLQAKMRDFTPFISQKDDYTYVFDKAETLASFEQFYDTNRDMAMRLYKYRWKNGVEQYMVLNIRNGYSHNVVLGTRGNSILFEYYLTQGGGSRTEEVGIVNVLIKNSNGEQTIQKTFSIDEEKELNVDDYLIDGRNEMTLTVLGMQSGKSSTATIVFNVTEIDLVSHFPIQKIYSSGEEVNFNVEVNCKATKYVEWNIDKQTSPSGCSTEILSGDKTCYISVVLPTSVGKHTLQLRVRTEIDGVTYYSRVIYHEFVVTGADRDYVVISRKLDTTSFLQGNADITIHCERYVMESIEWAYKPYILGKKPTIMWQLIPLSGGDSTTLSTRIDEGTTSVDGKLYTLDFMPTEKGDFTLRATIENEVLGAYTTHVSENSRGLVETTSALMLKLSAIGRSNSEPSETIDKWKYKGYSTTFNNVPFTSGCGWVDNALVISGGATATINISPFAGATAEDLRNKGRTVEVEFETFNLRNENTPLFYIGNVANNREIVKITGTSASLRSNGGAQILDRFTTNTRVKFAFIVHDSSTGLMEIINNGISSRVQSYGSSDFANNSQIVIGGTTDGSIKIYSIRVYDNNISTQQELRNLTIDTPNVEEMTKLIEENNIYTNGEVDVDLIKDRIAVMYVTGKGGNNVLQSIWDSVDMRTKVQILADVEWKNPKNPSSNWRCENMRIRSHGQTTLRNPLKSLKIWIDDNSKGTYGTKFYPNGSEEAVTKPRWSMKDGAMPMNKFVMQCYYIDSSNCKSPALLRLIDDTMKRANIVTPPIEFARDVYPTKMREKYGNAYQDSAYKFPYEIRMTPDSIPCVIVSRDDASKPWHYDGIFVLMDDKKSDFLYGQRSIYNYIGDPYTFNTKKDKKDVLWDNKDVSRWEFTLNDSEISAFTNIEDWWSTPKEYADEDADPNEVISSGEGGEQTLTTDKKWEFENSIEIIYPDRDDLNDEEYRAQATKIKEFFDWVNSCYKDYLITHNHGKFWTEAPLHMLLNHWAAYYVFAMKNGAFDSLVRNLQLTTFDGVHYLPLWWDVDIQYGTINSGQLLFDEPPIDRTTQKSGNYAFRGDRSYLWQALEETNGFLELCRSVMTALYSAGFTKSAIFALQKEYTNTWSAALYNESEDYKYKQMYLKNKASNAKYLLYNLGNGDTFREWWITKQYKYWDSRLASGSFVEGSISWRWGGTPKNTIFNMVLRYGEPTYFGYAIGDNPKIQSNGKYSIDVQPSQTINIPLHDMDGSQALFIYNPQSLEYLDLSAQFQNLQDASLQGCYDSTVGSMLKELIIGVSDAELENGVRNTQIKDSISGLGDLVMLEKLKMQGVDASGVSTYGIPNATNIKELYLKGSVFAQFNMPSSVHLRVAEFPCQLSTIYWDDIVFDSLKFYDYSTLEEFTFPRDADTIELHNMGEDNTIRAMIREWLRYHDSNGSISSCKLDFYNINWDDATYEEVLRLAVIPKAMRNYTGVINLTETLSREQMTTLSELFNDETKGINVFDKTSAFRIDSGSGVSVNAQSSILAGNSTRIEATVFPLSSTNKVIEYQLTDGSYDSNTHIWTYANASLNQDTGELITIENGAVSYQLKVKVKASYTTTNGENKQETKDFTISVIKRTYPTSITLSGKTAIDTLDGNAHQSINIVFNGEYNGNISEVRWTHSVNTTQTQYISNIRTDNTAFSYDLLTISSDETCTLSVSCTVVFRDGSVKSANLIVSIHRPNQVLTAVLNSEVYNIMVLSGLTRQGYGYMTDIEAWQVRDTAVSPYKAMPWGTLRNSKGNIRHFEEISWFYYLTAVDFSAYYNLDTKSANDTYDFSGMANLKTLDLRGTTVSAQGMGGTLTDLALGAPKKVYANGCTALTSARFTIQDVSRIESVDFSGINYGFNRLVDIIERKAVVAKSKAGVSSYDDGGVGSGNEFEVVVGFDTDGSTLKVKLKETITTKSLNSSYNLIVSEEIVYHRARIVIIDDISSNEELKSTIDNENEKISVYNNWQSLDNPSMTIALIGNDITENNVDDVWATKTINLNNVQAWNDITE